jgi:hypothetical protein
MFFRPKTKKKQIIKVRQQSDATVDAKKVRLCVEPEVARVWSGEWVILLREVEGSDRKVVCWFD